jgi:hypothetical protein
MGILFETTKHFCCLDLFVFFLDLIGFNYEY